MKIHCSYDEIVKVTDLKPHPKNRNKHPDDQITRLAKILKYQGIRKPITISRQSGYITAGHGRLAAALKNKWTEFPVDYQDYDDDEQEYADVQSDNAIASWAELDLSEINTDIGELGPDFDIDLLGLKDFNLDFEPGSEDDQGKLDEKQMIYVECPNCGEEFEKSQGKERQA